LLDRRRPGGARTLFSIDAEADADTDTDCGKAEADLV
jgi:hypothetical protein